MTTRGTPRRQLGRYPGTPISYLHRAGAGIGVVLTAVNGRSHRSTILPGPDLSGSSTYGCLQRIELRRLHINRVKHVFWRGKSPRM
jgi:hypothetical protein